MDGPAGTHHGSGAAGLGRAGPGFYGHTRAAPATRLHLLGQHLAFGQRWRSGVGPSWMDRVAGGDGSEPGRDGPGQDVALKERPASGVVGGRGGGQGGTRVGAGGRGWRERFSGPKLQNEVQQYFSQETFFIMMPLEYKFKWQSAVSAIFQF
jgi:hypothetical protein